MLYPLLLLIAEAGAAPRLQSLRQRRWRPTVLVPRQYCLFESVPCAEVRLHELSNFVQLQVRRLSPFARPEATALRRNDRLLLWIWDADEIEPLLKAADPGSVHRARVAECLYLPLPATDGAHDRRCTQGNERLHLAGEAVVQSAFIAGSALDSTVLLTRPLGHDWAANLSSDALLSKLDANSLFAVLSWATALVMLAAAAFQWGMLRGTEHAVIGLEAGLAKQMEAGGERAELKRKAERDLEWVQTYEESARQVDIPTLLDSLRPFLERQGVVIREWESESESVKVVLASAGGEIRLPELLEDLKSMPGLSDVQMQQHEELASATFVFRPHGWLLSPARADR